MNAMDETKMRHREEVEIDLLLEGLFRIYEADFRGYERQRLRKHLFAFMNGRGLPTVATLLAAVLHDPTMADELCQALIGRHDGFFQDVAQFVRMREVLGPTLGSYPAPKLWIAECTSAEEVFAFAIMLAEEKLLERTLIFATCSNASLLEEIRRGSFAIERLPEYEQAYRAAGGRQSLRNYVVQHGGNAVFTEALRSRIIWAQYNLSTDGSFNEFQLISCPQSLFEFGPALRKRILGLFHQSLVHFGILNAPLPADAGAFALSTHYKMLGNPCLYRRVL